MALQVVELLRNLLYGIERDYYCPEDDHYFVTAIGEDYYACGRCPFFEYAMPQQECGGFLF